MANFTDEPSSAALGESADDIAGSIRPGAYKWYVAAVLCLAHTVAMVDRFVTVVVAEPVKAAMGLSDGQLGLLQGTGFALLYCGFAIPLGCVADATNRRNLIVAGLSIWSLATCAAAFATSFETLFAARILVGFGEACLIPCAMSLLLNYFGAGNVARGTAIFASGANMGNAFAFLGGGALLAALEARGGLLLGGRVRVAPWQGLFLAAGIAALPVLLLLLVTVKEPTRPGAAPVRLRDSLAAIRQGLTYLVGQLRNFAPFLLVGSMTVVCGYSVTSWSTSIFVRLHGLSAPDASLFVGLASLVAGPLGAMLGGIALDRLQARDVAGAPLVLMAMGACVGAPLAILACFVPNVYIAAVCFAVFIMTSGFNIPSLYMGMQLMTSDRYRGVAASFNMMVYTIAGLGFGPPSVGFVSDLMGGSHASLGYAIAVMQTTMVLLIVPTVLTLRRRYQRVADQVG